jgi:type IV pilus assembly protein PilM
MLNTTKSFLAVDFGAGSLKAAEFEVNEAGGLRLKQYALKTLGAEGAQESTREATILKALNALIAEKGIKAKAVNVCAPGFHVFSKFVKLPPVDASKVTQIIQYEAQQNVPFPLAEVVWDYQILGSTPGGELEVLLVAIKADIVEGLFRVTESAGLHLQVADVSPAALCNAFRYNYGDLDDCTMLLDIGAKTSNLLFFEKGKVFSRSINLGANSITQDFANESKLKYDVAEKIKIEEGFVSLGGAYEEPENPNQAAISKIARQFMTRLHIQVNQTMQFYRGQQGGSAPQRLFLSGGASIMAYTAQFFAEKLNVPVEYFNPLRNVQIDPAINLEELARVAHSMGEVIGLGLRNLAHCPVELNLMPESTLKWQAFNQKKPYFIATVFSLVLVVAAMAFIFAQLAGVRQKALDDLVTEGNPQEARDNQFQSVMRTLQKTQKESDQVISYVGARFFWVDVFNQLRNVLMKVEVGSKAKFRTDAGVWIERIMTSPEVGELDVAASPDPAAATGPFRPMGTAAENEAFRRRYGLDRMPMPMAVPTPDGAVPADQSVAGATGPRKRANTNEVDTIDITFKAVSLQSVSASANNELAFAVRNELRNDPMFVSEETDFSDQAAQITADEPPGVFTFQISAKLKRPLKLSF